MPFYPAPAPAPHLPSLTNIATTLYSVGAGGPGWVDTDVSAVLGTDTSKIWVAVARLAAGGGGEVGARPHGAALACQGSTNGGAAIPFTVSATGHVDFYQNAASATEYRVIGYIS